MRTIVTFCCVTLVALTGVAQAATPKPLKALLITGGCCHDYGKQKDLLKAGIEARAHVIVDQIHTDDKTTKARFEIYEKADWAKGYDVVIHDECTSDVKDMPYVENILNAHKNGVAAVNLHCAMHCYRVGTDDWFKFVGIHSTGHGPQKPIEITFTDKSNDITKSLAVFMYSALSLSTDHNIPRLTRSRYRASPTVSLLCPRVVLKTRALPN